MMALQERSTSVNRKTADRTPPCNPAVAALDERLAALARMAGGDFSAALRQMSGEEAPAGHAPADYDPLATDLETRARALLIQSHLSPAEESHVSDLIKCASDLRCVARCAHLIGQLSYLFTSVVAGSCKASANIAIPDSVCPVSIFAGDLAGKTVAALASGDPRDALNAATRFRDVERARRDAELALRRSADDLPPTVQRVTCALLWSVVVAAESMARVAARHAVPK